jgi:hypothetical protein
VQDRFQIREVRGAVIADFDFRHTTSTMVVIIDFRWLGVQLGQLPFVPGVQANRDLHMYVLKHVFSSNLQTTAGLSITRLFPFPSLL